MTAWGSAVTAVASVTAGDVSDGWGASVVAGGVSDGWSVCDGWGRQ